MPKVTTTIFPAQGVFFFVFPFCGFFAALAKTTPKSPFVCSGSLKNGVFLKRWK